jgi:hypothetical protein
MVTIGLGGKSTSSWKLDWRQFWKWGWVCNTHKNPILESNIGQIGFENKGKAYKAQVVFTTRSGTAGRMDWGFLEKAQFQMTISTKRDVIDYSSKWMDVVYFSATIYGSES